MGETRVDLVHLLEDLRDGYPGPVEETILTEVVANALDSGAKTLRFIADPGSTSLIAIDDGSGMSRAELTRYHDLAASNKQRGRGIGFAGVGIKLGLLVSEEVVTETRRGRSHIATAWALTSRRRAPWAWVEPPRWIETATGTAVAFRLNNPLSPLLDPGFIAAVVLRHFQPLFEPEFLEILAPQYPDGLTILVNESVIVGPIRGAPRVPISIRKGRQRKPSVVGYIAKHSVPLPEADQGLAISTLGKVIRRGWDWLGISPADRETIEGLIEVPALAETLTLTKTDFLRSGARGALFLSYRKAIQEVVAEQLRAWGATPPPPQRTRRTAPLERDIQRVLGDLASEFPLLSTLAEPTSGGQRRLELGSVEGNGETPGTELLHAGAGGAPGTDTGTGSRDVSPPAQAEAGGVDGSQSSRREPDQKESETPPSLHLPGAGRRPRRARLTLRIQFESRPDDLNLARLVDSTAWINDAHPAFRRASASRSEGYHMAVAVASALAPLTVEPARSQDFVNAFLARWGVAGHGRDNGV